jgi:preprotein translocase subunit SecE
VVSKTIGWGFESLLPCHSASPEPLKRHYEKRTMANPFRKSRIFLGETSTELKKAVWPTKTELRDSTIVVFIATLLLGAYVALADFSVYNWIQLLTNWVRG